MPSKNSSYLIVALILAFFSILGALYLFRYTGPVVENKAAPTPVDRLAAIPTPLPLIDNSVIVTRTPTFSPEFQSFTSSYDRFSVVYALDRKLYEDKGGNGGNRYTFYRKNGNITVHVGKNWSWVHPGRVLTSDFHVSGQSTFRYDISQQTIVDIQYDDLNYTIQCIHGAVASNKAECEQFLANFKFLTK